MFCPLLPCGDCCVVVPAALAAPRGLITIPQSLQDAPRRGEVVAVGPDVSEALLGATVAWRALCGTSVEIGEGSWLLLREEDLLCRLK